MHLILFNRGKTSKTGRMLRQLLGLKSNISLERGYIRPHQISTLIRWGSTELEDAPKTLNTRQAVALSSNKLKALEKMRDSSVNVPWFTTDRDLANSFCSGGKYVVGRTTYHQGGNNFVVTNSPSYDRASSHWLELINKISEWRVHVFKDEVIGVSRKTSEGVESRIRHKHAWNHTNGYRFIKCDIDLVQPRLKQIAISAVKSLGLDFGAVDIILSNGQESTSSGSRKYYVLEVNSAPSLEPNSTILRNYLDRIWRWLNE